MSNPKDELPAVPTEALFGRVVSILDQARGNVVRAVNTSMVHAYWLIGREIVMGFQEGEQRAEYGKRLLGDLSSRLTKRYGKGFSEQSLQNFRKFYLAYHERITIPSPVGRKSGDEEILSPPGRELALPTIQHPLGAELPQAFSPQLTCEVS